MPHCVAAWIDILQATDKLLRAGLRARIGPDGDLQAAHREWYINHMREHDQVVEKLARALRSGASEVGDAR